MADTPSPATSSEFARSLAKKHLETTLTVGAKRLMENVDESLQEVRDVLEEFKDRDGCFDACWDRLGINKGHTSLCQRAHALMVRLAIEKGDSNAG